MGIAYCPSCGSKSNYQFAAPNFCSKCGQAYLSKSSSALKMKKAPQNDVDDENESYESDEDNFDDSNSFSNSLIVPRISRIQVDLDFSTSEVKSFKFGEIFGENAVEARFPIKKTRDINDLL
jgi:hypothetical protein